MYCILILDLAVCEHSVIKQFKPNIFCITAKPQLFWSALEHYTQLVLSKWNVAWTVLNTCSPDWKAVLREHKAQKKAIRLQVEKMGKGPEVSQTLTEKTDVGVGDWAQWLKMLNVLAKKLGSIPNTHIRGGSATICNADPRGKQHPFLASAGTKAYTCAWTYMQAKPIKC